MASVDADQVGVASGVIVRSARIGSLVARLLGFVFAAQGSPHTFLSEFEELH
jgi:hypothetical protein